MRKCEDVIVHVVGTGSKGNGYLVEVGNSKIILDAGVLPQKMRKANKNKIADIDAIFVTHSHFDHAKYLEDYVGLGVRLIYGTDEIETEKFIAFGEYQEHDVPCRGYSIFYPQYNIMLHYITDTKSIQVSKELLKKACKHYWLVECNYTDELMHKNDYELGASVAFRNQRTRETHMSDKTLLKFFKRNSVQADGVLILHCSSTNFDKKQFCKDWAEIHKSQMKIVENGSKYVLHGKSIRKEEVI